MFLSFGCTFETLGKLIIIIIITKIANVFGAYPRPGIVILIVNSRDPYSCVPYLMR